MPIEAGSGADVVRVAIDARLQSGKSGGVESVVLGLAHGLSQLGDGDEEYLFLAYRGHEDWIRRHVSGPCRLLTVPYEGGVLRRAWSRVDRAMPRLATAVRRTALWRRYRGGEIGEVPSSDGTLEAAGVDVVHFPFQSGFLTDLPSIYHPHDLQHRHLPQFFTPQQYRARELTYRTLCEDSAMLAVVSEWVRNDVIAAYDLSPDKVFVVPFAPPVDAYVRPSPETVSRTRVRHSLPRDFVLYPAATWPHKNHVRLLEALANLRDRGVEVPLVCTGLQDGHFDVISRRIKELRLSGLVRFLGFVSPEDLGALYAAARAVVIPTEFEAASFPVWEAFRAGVPVACSNVTSLPEQAGDAAVLFGPRDVDAIARAVERLWTDEQLRQELIHRGHHRVGRFDWVTTARIFRAHYRRLAGAGLTDDDRVLIDSPPAL